MDDLVVRGAVTDLDIIAIHRMLMIDGEEIADVTVDPIVVMEDIYGLVRGEGRGAFLMAIVGDELAGVMGLENVRFRYSQEWAINEVYLFVHPSFRNGDVMTALLQEARAIADEVGKDLYVRIANPKRRRGSREKVFDLLRYQPVGSIYAFRSRA